MIKKLKDIILSKINSNPFIKNVLLISGSTVIGQVFILLIYPVVSRLYSVSDFGIFQLAQSYLSFMIVAGSLRYENAILLPEEDSDSRSVWQLTLLINLFFFIVFLLVLAVTFILRLNFGALLGIGAFIYFLPFIFLGAVVYQSLVYLNLRIRSFSTIGKTKIFQSVGNGTTQVFLGAFNVGAIGLFSGDLIGRSAGIFNLLRQSFKAWGNTLFTFNFNGIKRQAIRYKDFAIYNTPGALLNTAGFTLPALFIGKIYGLEILGLFAIVDRVYAAPSALIGQSISQVFMSESASLINGQIEQLRTNYISILKKLAIVFIIPTIIVILFGPELFKIILGKKWARAGEFASILAIMQFFSFIVWPLIPTLIIMQLQKVQMVWEVSRVICILIGFYVCDSYKLNSNYAIMFYSFVMGLFYVLHVFLTLHFIKRRIKQENLGKLKTKF
jgi:O-antigen/teichoic acid export membrane protein